MFDVGTIIALMFWGAINFFVAHLVASKNENFNINPILYALGAMTFGGIYPLIFLGCKYLWFRSKNNKNNEVKELKKRIQELEDKNND